MKLRKQVIQEEQMMKGLLAGKSLNDLIEKLAADTPADVLERQGVHYLKWTGHMEAIAGIFFRALKESVKGDFKKRFIGKNAPVSYQRVLDCMKAAEVVATHPIFGDLRSSRSFRNLLMLPEPDRAALAEEIRDTPAEQLDEFLPEKIEERYRKLKRRHGGETKAEGKAGEPVAQAGAAVSDVVPTDLAILIGRAEAALYAIFKHKIPPAEWPACRKYHGILNKAKDHAAYTLNDPTHEKPPWWETWQPEEIADSDEVPE